VINKRPHSKLRRTKSKEINVTPAKASVQRFHQNQALQTRRSFALSSRQSFAVTPMFLPDHRACLKSTNCKPCEQKKPRCQWSGSAVGFKQNGGFVWKCVQFSKLCFSLEVIFIYTQISFCYIKPPSRPRTTGS